VFLNAINPPSDRADLLDRSLMVELDRIPDDERRSEEELWADFEANHSKLLGAVFHTLAEAMKVRHSLKLSERPRLADWGEYAAAVYEVMGFTKGDDEKGEDEKRVKSGAELFLDDWARIVKVQNQATIEGSPVALAIMAFMKDREEHSDTSTGLHKSLENVAASIGLDTDRDKMWPKSARWLWRRIKEVVPTLAAAGIEATRRDTNAATEITLRKSRELNSTNSTEKQNRIDKRKKHGFEEKLNSTYQSSSTVNSTSKAGSHAARGNSGDIFAASSEDTDEAHDPPVEESKSGLDEEEEERL
jgi:hypothetical protein